jgi:Cd2+/Zn2+-exporting ATPase
VALWLAVLADMGTSIAVTLNGLRLFNRKRA